MNQPPEDLEEALLKFHEERANLHSKDCEDEEGPSLTNTALYLIHADLACFYRDRLGKWKEFRDGRNRQAPAPDGDGPKQTPCRQPS